jgi:hypothetical protein
MTLKYVLGATLIAAAAIVAPMQPAHAKIWVDGIGAMKCGEVITYIKEKPEIGVNSLAQWAYGYMTRRNFEQANNNRPQVDLTKNFDGNKMLTIIVGTCEKHPDEMVVRIVNELFDMLLKDQAVVT